MQTVRTGKNTTTDTDAELLKLYLGLTKAEKGIKERKDEIKREIYKRGLDGQYGDYTISHSEGVNYRYQEMVKDELGETRVKELRPNYATGYKKITVKKK